MTPPAARRNPVNRNKIVGSKWTATRPVDRQKHFIVIDWVRDEDGTPTELIEIEAVLTRNVSVVHWRELGDPAIWRIGWR
jgi:tryptophan-rich hypothetical protein